MKQVFIATLILLVTIPAALLAVKGVTSSWDDEKQPVRVETRNANGNTVPEVKVVQTQNSDSRDLPFKEEISKSYKLNPGAEVEVKGVNGSVDIETFDSPNAEVHIIRSARKQETLQNSPTSIEQSPDLLSIDTNYNQRKTVWDLFKLSDGRDLRMRVMLKLPRSVKLTIQGTNGNVNVGELDDVAVINSVNGRVKLAQVTGSMWVNHVNGRVECAVKNIRDGGIELQHINGPVEVRFAGEVNADVEVRGLNGPFNAQLPNLAMGEKRSRSSFEAKIGNGGVPIEIRSVNGPISFLPIETTAKANGSGASSGTSAK